MFVKEHKNTINWVAKGSVWQFNCIFASYNKYKYEKVWNHSANSSCNDSLQ